MKLRLATPQKLLLRSIVEPKSVLECGVTDWELLLYLARQAKVLGVLAAELERQDLLSAIPERAANQLRSSLMEIRNLQRLARWELNRIRWALQGALIPVVILKGLAYVFAGLPSAGGRHFVDLDILVRAEQLEEFERLLLSGGWQSQELSAYDEHYYRAWAHEIPPLLHPERRTEIDVHHAIAPITSRLKTNTAPLFDAAVTVPPEGFQILCPVDMTLQCAVNLFQNNEICGDLRDLLDLHDALRTFAGDDSKFWSKLVERSNRLKLGRPLFYGLQFSRLIFQTSVPADLEFELAERPGIVARSVMRWLVPKALFPAYPNEPSMAGRCACFILFVRSHWIRMPAHLLLLHVAYKCFAQVFPGAKRRG